MKKINRILTTILAIALVALLPGFGSAKVKAAPNSFTVKWLPEMNEWRVQMLSPWDDSRENGTLDFLWANLKEGDSLVIVGGDGAPSFVEDLHIKVKLANLTLYEMKNCLIVYAEQNIKDVYVLKGSVASLNGSYDNVYVYDDSKCNVNNDVPYLYIGGETSMKMHVSALGTVGHCKIENKGSLIKEMYNVKANTLRVVDGTDKTDAANYSTTASGTPAATTTTTSTTTTTTPATTTSGVVSPKTGEGNVMLLLFLGAAACFAGSIYARKKMA